MMVDWGSLLERKYDIMQQNADSQRLGVEAAAKLDTTRAGLLPAESASNIALQAAQRGLTRANTRNVDETTRFVGPLANANINYLGAQANESGARAGLYGAQTVGERQLNDYIASNPGAIFGRGAAPGPGQDSLYGSILDRSAATYNPFAGYFRRGLGASTPAPAPRSTGLGGLKRPSVDDEDIYSSSADSALRFRNNPYYR